MKYIKSDKFNLLQISFRFKGYKIFALKIIAGFSLNEPDELLEDGDMWTRVEQALGKDQVLDYVHPKPRGEVLVTGRCYAPGGQPVPACPVSIQVGNISKTINVFGDRHWITVGGSALTASKPVPFEVMDISWENALGGPRDQYNPVGKGPAKTVDQNGKTVWPLPNIEDPRHLVASPDDRPRPAGLAPMGLTWPERMKNMGSYGAAWLAQTWPGIPDDVDRVVMQFAPEDQRVSGFHKGDEKIRLEHLHPEKPLIESRLPGVRTRLFLNYETVNGLVFEELPTGLETIWLFPDKEFGLLAWQAYITLGQEDLRQVHHVVAFPEHLAEAPLPKEHYRALLDRPPDIEEEIGDQTATPESDAAIRETTATLKEQPIKEKTAPLDASTPEAAPPPVAETSAIESAPSPETTPEPETPLVAEKPDMEAGSRLAEYEARARDAEARLVARLKASGIDTGKYKAMSAYSPPTDQPLPQSSEERITYFQERAQTANDELKQKLRRSGIDPNIKPEIQSPAVPKTGDQLIRSARNMGYEDPKLFDFIRGLEDEIRQAKTELSAMGVDVSSEKSGRLVSGTPADDNAQYPDVDASPRDTPARDPISELETAPKPSGTPVSRETIMERFKSGQSLAGADLSKADLSGLDLAGVNLENALLEGTDLSGANLIGANLNGAILTGADLSRANLESASLKECSASGLNAASANMNQAELSDADLTGAVLTGVAAVRASVSRAILEGANLNGADFSQCDAGEIDLTAAILDKADFQGANLQSGQLSAASLNSTNFTGADLGQAWFSESRGDKALFKGAGLKESKAQGSTFLPGADFSEANFGEAYWEDADLSGAVFKKADLTRSAFVKCDLTGADLQRVDAKYARFHRSKLSNAKLSASNFFKGSFRRSHLDSADFQDSNLFSVDLYKAVYGHTNMKNANINRTLLTARATVMR